MSTFTAKQAETLVALYRARGWGVNPDWPLSIHRSKPCTTRDTPSLRGRTTQIRALAARGLCTIEEQGHGMGACGTWLSVTLTEQGVQAAREHLGPECLARVARYAAKAGLV